MLSQEVREKAESRVGLVLCEKWRLDRVIGVGGMAAVYQATHRNQNQVAIKLLHPQWSLDDSTKKRFLREGYVANSIRHSGAVKILDDYADASGLAFLVMELLEGETLEDRIVRKGGQLEVSDALKITDQVLAVLEAAHDQGILHRDIKPDNIFVTRAGEVKILDFGIARLSSSHDYGGTKVGSFMGTPAYSAPEQARGHWDHVDARTDLYSVAATLYSLVTGRHVHEAETSSEQLALAIGSRAPRLQQMMPKAGHELACLIDKGLQYAQEERFQTSRAMRAEVLRTLAGLPITASAQPSSIPPSYEQEEISLTSGVPTENFFPSHRVRIGLTVLAGVAIATLLVLATTQNHWQPEIEEKAQKTASGDEVEATTSIEKNSLDEELVQKGKKLSARSVDPDVSTKPVSSKAREEQEGPNAVSANAQPNSQLPPASPKKLAPASESNAPNSQRKLQPLELPREKLNPSPPSAPFAPPPAPPSSPPSSPPPPPPPPPPSSPPDSEPSERIFRRRK